jgi:PAS domain S-box-containing protein
MTAFPRNPIDEAGSSRIAHKAVLGLTALLILLVLAGTGTMLWYQYDDAIEDAKASTANLATVLEEHAQRTLRVVKVMLEGLSDRFTAEGYLGEFEFERVHRTLAARKHSTNEVLNLTLLDADGRLVTDASGSRIQIDLSERAYVKFHRENAQAGIHISEPLTSFAGRGRIIVVSHRLSHVDGSFAGIVTASVSTEYFQDFYRSIDVGPRGVVTLRTKSDNIVARHPPNEALLPSGGAEASSRVAREVTSGRSFGTEDHVGRFDRNRRITSYRVIPGIPFVVSVGRAHADFLAPWWRNLRRYGIAALVLVMAIVASSWFLLRQMAARESAAAAKLAGERAAAEAIRQSQAQEHRTRERLETILERMPIGSIVSDTNLRITYVNPAAERIFGCRFEDVKGLTPRETGFIAADESAAEARRESLRRGEMSGYTVVQKLTKNGRTIICEWTNTTLTGPDGSFAGILSMCQDITERSSAEEALRQAQKMDALGQLTGGVAHDFNNLLTVIMANVELAKFAVEDRPIEAGALQAALDAAVRGAELTHQLLAFSRRQTLEPKVVDLNALVRGMMRLLSRIIGENIEPTLRTAPDVWPVRIDPTQLETALTNLVVNARDAMPGGGQLIIETENGPLDETYAAQHADVPPGDYVALSVSDTGTGMSREVVDRVFEPFFTTKEVGKGTGLGMSMVFGFVKQSGGHIRIYSEVGIGTTIRLYLPRATEAIDGIVELEPAAAPSPAKGEMILVVEDDEAVRTVVTKNLERYGYRVESADSARSAFEILNRADSVDLLFTDMVMPGGINGAELAIRAREKRPGLKVMLTSGYTAPALASQMLEVEGAAIVSKPYRMIDLAREIRGILDRA